MSWQAALDFADRQNYIVSNDFQTALRTRSNPGPDILTVLKFLLKRRHLEAPQGQVKGCEV